MEENAPINACLSALTNDNPVIFTESCKTLFNSSTTAAFKAILPDRLEEIIPLLVRKCQWKSQSNNRYYATDLQSPQKGLTPP